MKLKGRFLYFKGINFTFYCLIIMTFLFIPNCSPHSSEFLAGSRYMMIGDNEHSILKFNQAIDKNPKDTLAYYSRGVAFSNTQQYDKAIPDFDKVIEMNRHYLTKSSEKNSSKSNSQGAYGEFHKIAEMDRAAKIGVGSRAGMAGALGFDGQSTANNDMEKMQQIMITKNALTLRASSSKRRAESFESLGKVPEALAAYTEYIYFYNSLEPIQQDQTFVKDMYIISKEKSEKLKKK